MQPYMRGDISYSSTESLLSMQGNIDGPSHASIAIRIVANGLCHLCHQPLMWKYLNGNAIVLVIFTDSCQPQTPARHVASLCMPHHAMLLLTVSHVNYHN
mmetsp:Transcript_5560/g.12318  ORF Transcript_5560/g.12318 Transcript_5560/m.12318 type:complete len:100 (-) Transcript_5560:718-1017(-)